MTFDKSKPPLRASRRRFVQGLVSGGVLASLGFARTPSEANSGMRAKPRPAATPPETRPCTKRRREARTRGSALSNVMLQLVVSPLAMSIVNEMRAHRARRCNADHGSCRPIRRSVVSAAASRSAERREERASETRARPASQARPASRARAHRTRACTRTSGRRTRNRHRGPRASRAASPCRDRRNARAVHPHARSPASTRRPASRRRTRSPRSVRSRARIRARARPASARCVAERARSW